MAITPISVPTVPSTSFNRNPRRVSSQEEYWTAGAVREYLSSTETINVGRYSTVSMDEYTARFAGYDNSHAYQQYLQNQSPVAVITVPENAERKEMPELDFDFEHIKPMTQDERREGIDRWLSGEGLFDLDFIGGISSDLFSPMPSPKAWDIINTAKSFRTYSGPYTKEIAEAMRAAHNEVKALTPNDFSWGDYSGLRALTLDERKTFVNGMQSLFDKTGIQTDASLMNFTFQGDSDVLQSVGAWNHDEDVQSRVIKMFNDYEGLDQEGIDLVNQLRELGKKTSQNSYVYA